MNVILAYLNTMFSAYPQTPRLLEAKTELQGMMEDAYTSLIAEGRSENEAVGQVIRDFGNLEEVAPVLGITADIAPEPPITGPGSGSGSGSALPGSAPAAPRPQHPPVTMDEAEGYADAQHRIRFRVGTAIALFVLAPAALISLPTAAESEALRISPEASALIGIVTLLALVAIGVMLLVSTSREMAPYKRVVEKRFTSDPSVTRWAESLAQQHERGRIRALQIAIAFWILAPAPLISFSLLRQDSPRGDLWSVLGVVLVLMFVATGLVILLPASWANTVAEKLTSGGSGGRGGSAASDDDEDRSVIGVIAAFYWPLLTAIYLAWSFIGDAWGSSWIVWPIGAVLFGAIAAGGGALESYRRGRN